MSGLLAQTRRVATGVAKRLLGRSSAAAPTEARERLSHRYLHGAGLEVGALHSPLAVGPRASVTYVDRMSVDDLRKSYPELRDLPLTPVDVVDDGEALTKFSAKSQDFVISNHFLEHTQDPIRTLKRHLEVLKPGGYLYLAIPDKHGTFDKLRPETTIEHLMRDHRDGPAGSYEEHLREYARLVDGHEGQALEERVRFLRETNYSIHFHVWSGASFKSFLDYLANDLGMPMRRVEMVENPARAEHIVILQRT